MEPKFLEVWYRHVDDDEPNRERRWPSLVPEEVVNRLLGLMDSMAYVVLNSQRAEETNDYSPRKQF